MNDVNEELLEATRTTVDEDIDEPPMYRVIIVNDDFTPKDFVVELLVRLFHKSVEAATELMWRVHGGKKGVAGVYPREVAESKVRTGIALARENGYPLALHMEPDD